MVFNGLRTDNVTERAKLYLANPHKEGTITTNATARTQNPYINYVENNTFRFGVQIVGGTNTTVNAQDGVITINNTAGGGDSIWSTGNYSTIGEFITPKDAKTVYFGNKGETTIYYGTLLGAASLKFQRYGLAAATSPVEFNLMGAKFGVDSSLARETSVGGVSIAGELLVGKNGSKSNWIRVYSTGNNYSNAGGRHGEIRASNELAVGIMDGAFIYFKNIPGASNNNLQKYRVGINTDDPKTTLDVAGSIRVQDNPCVPNPCNENTVGSITFINNKFYGCKKKNPTTYSWYEFTMNDSNSDTLVSSLECLGQLAY